MKSSEYIDEQRKSYSLYVLQSRAIPVIADGLKAAARRVLWVARNGDKYKTATLAGRTLPLHPHAPPDGVINTLAAPYGNNIPLFDGFGAFGTLLNPTAYGASRYTSVKVSQFTKDVVFADLDLIPMGENYDGTELEPQHFLPLVPVILLNPSSGIAVGFASNILPRSLEDIINYQVKYLKGQKRLPTVIPNFIPTNNPATVNDGAYYFEGEIERVNTTTVRIVKFPFGLSHEKLTDHLDNLIEKQTIIDYEDNSKNVINIVIKFKRSVLSKYSDDELLALLKLRSREVENLTYIDFDGERVVPDTTPEQLIQSFTDWRLTWYLTRFQKRLEEVQQEIQRYKDILLAIKKNVGSAARQVQTRQELIDFLREIGVVNVEYIAGFPVYRFTVEEKNKVEEKLVEAKKKEKEYKELIKNEDKRKHVYIAELLGILTNYKKGTYTVKR